VRSGDSDARGAHRRSGQPPAELTERYGQADLEAVFLTVARNGTETARA